MREKARGRNGTFVMKMQCGGSECQWPSMFYNILKRKIEGVGGAGGVNKYGRELGIIYLSLCFEERPT